MTTQIQQSASEDFLLKEYEDIIVELRLAMNDVSKSLMKLASGIGNKTEKDALFALSNVLNDTQRSGRYRKKVTSVRTSIS